MGQRIVAARTATGELIRVTPYASEVTRAWVLNEIGTGSISFPITTPYLSELIAWGNILEIYEDGVPPWYGVVMDDRSWGAGVVTLPLRSLESLLQKKLTRQSMVLGGSSAVGGATAGQIAWEVFASGALRNGWSVLRAGIFDATRRHFVEYSYADVYDAFRKLSENYVAHFWVDDSYAVHFRDTRGSDKRATVLLAEDKHLTDVRLVESAADVVTNVVALGEGTNLLSRPKKALVAPSTTFSRAEVIEFPGVFSAEALVEPATEVLRTRGLPQRSIDANIVNENGVWGTFWVGDRVRLAVRATGVAEELTATVLGLELSNDGVLRGVFGVDRVQASVSPSIWVLS